MPDVDAIVIGSGPGGLTAALALAQQGELVLVFEQHYLPGGLCHSFPLGGYVWSPGIHYLGELQPGGAARSFYEGLGLGGDLVFCELNPDGYDHAIIGDRRYDYVAGRARNVEQLAAAFPGDAAGVRAYFKILDGIGEQGGAEGVSDVWGRWGATSLDNLLRHHVRDPVARAVLAFQGLNYSTPPSQTPVMIHAWMTNHYANGGWFPLGGGKGLAGAFIRALHRAGGEIQTRTPVAEILTEGGAPGRRAVGVRLASGETITARRIISNADPEVTYRQLVGSEFLSPALRRRLDQTRWSRSCLSLFVTLDIDPAAYGLDSGNYWLMSGPDLERMYTLGEGDVGVDDEVHGMFASVTTLKDPTSRHGGLHAIEAFALVAYDPFAPWAATDSETRPPAYARLKERLTDRMLDALSRLIPDIRDRVRFCSLGTPLTNAYYCRLTRGSVYGIERSLQQGFIGGFTLRSEVQDLYLCGASTMWHGVFGSSLSGLYAAALALGVSHPELLRPSDASIRLVPADRPEAWPEELKRRTRLT